MSDLIYMADTASANPPATSRLVTAYAGYVDGNYQSFPDLVRDHYPHAHLLSICVTADGRAEVLDVETGDASPDQARAWVQRMINAGVWRPCVYANGSTMPAVISALRGIPREDYRLWVAAYPGGGEVVPDGYDAHQYYGTPTGSWDYSVCLPSFFHDKVVRENHHHVRKAEPAPIERKPRHALDVHPKVAASTIAGAIAAAVQVVLTSHGVHALHLTTAEVGAITTAAAAISGYLKRA